MIYEKHFAIEWSQLLIMMIIIIRCVTGPSLWIYIAKRRDEGLTSCHSRCGHLLMSEAHDDGPIMPQPIVPMVSVSFGYVFAAVIHLLSVPNARTIESWANCQERERERKKIWGYINSRTTSKLRIGNDVVKTEIYAVIIVMSDVWTPPSN